MRSRGVIGKYLLVVVLLVGIVIGVIWYSNISPEKAQGASKPIILYVNQGNGRVNVTNFGVMADFAVAHGFNTVFFQVFRLGVLLFDQQDLRTFVDQAHQRNLSIFFALSFNDSSFQIPPSIYEAGENGISLDMSVVNPSSQNSLLASVKAVYGGETAVTVYPTDWSPALRPNLLVLETYSSTLRSYIKPGIIGSVEVVGTSSQEDYQSQVQYALKNSDGVMVFDYAGLVKSDY